MSDIKLITTLPTDNEWWGKGSAITGWGLQRADHV